MIPHEELDRRVKQARLLALMFLVIMPVVFLVVALFTRSERFYPDNGSRRFMLYVLFIVAFMEPIVSIFIKKFQVKNYLQTKKTTLKPGPLAVNKRLSEISPGRFYINVLITQLSFVSAVFVLGLIVYLITTDLSNMAYFYALGIIWSFIFWPREEKIITFINLLEVS
ncbi:MAG: hypothetical protein PHU88_12145 [candidate division Zixibacteria bacterium]|nr:hypothetical protein [candidate division Zixibacteria bacterium]MDD5427177.1 hypothetical protein [candidate division Zixibacteria bacterium]